tara:strand:- start:278 stop:649 length:372 start_codon:yes stop_codon:yes gene_type:complete
MINKINVRSVSNYIPKLSNKEDSLYYFLYSITIENIGENKVKLLSRCWNISNGLGEQKKVKGEGVIGQQPIIKPGEIFKYNSYCPLDTQFGFMDGYYMMKDEKNNIFKVKIPKFSLVLPNVIN